MTVYPPLLYLLSMALTACRTATQQTLPHSIPHFRPGWPIKHEGTLGGLDQDKPFFRKSCEGTR